MPQHTSQHSARPELLAPAGDWDCLRAAVENGADAVYLGLDDGFNARARAVNFRLDNLGEVMEYLHRRCVRGYITLNTLAFTDELPRIEEAVRQLAEAGVDAVLVQDLGVARLLKAVCPELTLHASTQMTLTSAECITAARDLGLERVVLPRELSVSEIQAIHRSSEMPLEAFVHGALCVAYSGQCLTSESLGGRSANRGQCAQACRLDYELICDGQDVDLGNQKYLLSPQDLAAFELTSDLIKAGVCSFKIEGRLKSPEYVANTVQHYRKAIDTAVAGSKATFTRREVNDLEMSFSRGFSPGWLQGCDHKMLVPATSSSKRGVLLGEIVQVFGDRVSVRLEAAISAGDGVVFEGDRAAGREQGGRVFEVFRNDVRQRDQVEGGIVDLTFGREMVNPKALRPGLKVWKTDDPQLNKRLRASYEGADAVRRVAVDLTVTAEPGRPLCVSASADNGTSCEVQSEQPLEVARKHALTQDGLRQQLNRLGGTIYQLRNLTATISGSPMVPLSVLGKIRRDLIQKLDAAPLPRCRSIAVEPVLPRLRSELRERKLRYPKTQQPAAVPSDGEVGDTSNNVHDQPTLSVLCRSLEQLHTLLEEEVASIYVDFADIRQYREAIAAGRQSGCTVFPATPRIQKPGEMGIFNAMLKAQPDGVLIRNLSAMEYFVERQIPVVADFSLNVTNELTAAFLMERGTRRVTASYDMNRDQLLDLVASVPPDWLEVVIHQHMPMFHMEHCVFCSVLSPGSNKTNCGRPCDVHKVELRDRIGMEHPLTADVGCRNTLFNATPQSSAEVVPQLMERGLRHFRVELLHDSAPQIRNQLRLYRQLLSGQVSGSDVWKQLKAANRVGVTRGTLEERRNPLAIL